MREMIVTAFEGGIAIVAVGGAAALAWAFGGKLAGEKMCGVDSPCFMPFCSKRKDESHKHYNAIYYGQLSFVIASLIVTAIVLMYGVGTYLRRWG